MFTVVVGSYSMQSLGSIGACVFLVLQDSCQFFCITFLKVFLKLLCSPVQNFCSFFWSEYEAVMAFGS